MFCFIKSLKLFYYHNAPETSEQFKQVLFIVSNGQSVRTSESYRLAWHFPLKWKIRLKMVSAKNSFNSKPLAEHSQVPQAFLAHSPLLPRISRINKSKNENNILKLPKSFLHFLKKARPICLIKYWRAAISLRWEISPRSHAWFILSYFTNRLTSANFVGGGLQ